MEIYSKSDEVLQKEERYKQTQLEYQNGDIKFSLVSPSTSFTDHGLQRLLKIKELFQVQLPKMPREYILRQIFDHKHKTLCMHKNGAIIGAICFRPFYLQKFCEIVFLAVNFNSQIKGNGGFMVNVLKEVFKFEIFNFFKGTNASEEIKEFKFNEIKYEKLDFPVYFMTYADNSAIGFFKKQGFTHNLSFDGWIGYVKDYEGGTLMECRVYWEFDYLNMFEIIENARKETFKEVAEIPTFGPLPRNIDYVKEIGIYEFDEKSRIKSQREKVYNFLRYILADVCSHSSAWPFLQPVNEKEVPDYYKVVKQPMDFSKMQDRIDCGYYNSVEGFVKDFDLVVKNCFTYNAQSTQYYKCGERINDYFKKKIETYKNVKFFDYKIF